MNNYIFDAVILEVFEAAQINSFFSNIHFCQYVLIISRLLNFGIKSLYFGKISTYHQELWDISANLTNYFELFATHSFTNFIC